MKKSLEYIIKVSEYGNINKAAAKLYITPSALSKFIITKERELGIELFHRTGKKFILTYAGERYVDWAKKLMRMQESMEREMTSIAEEKTGLMRLGFQLMQSKILFSEIIPKFKEEYPLIDIVLESSYTVELFRMLEEGSIEFAVTTHNTVPEGFEAIKLTSVEIAAIVPKGHPVCRKSVIRKGFKYPWVDIRELKDETFVGLQKDQESRKVMDMVFESYGISPKINMQVHTTDLTLLSVANNFGVTIAYDLPAYLLENKDAIEILSFGEEAEVRDLSVVYKKESEMTGYIERFVEICKAVYGKF